MAITFAVDRVAPAPAPPVTVPLRQHLGGYEVCALPPDLQVVPLQHGTSLLSAVHTAFVEHRPLTLSPDAVWLTLATGISQHFQLHAELLRPRTVAHEGRKRLVRRADAAPTSTEEWAAAIRELGELTSQHLRSGLAKLLRCTFSTSGEAERIASEVVLLESTSSYFELVTVICGIPEITLTGTPDDWKAIRARVDLLAELELGAWAQRLAPLLDQLVAAALGKPQRAFFQRIYRMHELCGGPLVSGWIALLYPYVRGASDEYDTPNPLLTAAAEPQAWYRRLFSFGSAASDAPGRISGVAADRFPLQPSRAVLVFEGGARPWEQAVEGGVMAVTVSPSGSLEPRVGWCVRPPQQGSASLLHQMSLRHRVVPRAAAAPAASGAPQLRWHPQKEPLLRALREAFLFESRGTWHILPEEQREVLELDPNLRHLRGQKLVALPEGRFLFDVDPTDRPVIALGRPGMRLEELKIVGASLQEVLAQALDRDGELDAAAAPSLCDACSGYWDGWTHAAPLRARLRALGVALLPEQPRWHLRLSFVDEAIPVGTRTWKRYEGSRAVPVVLGAGEASLTVTPFADLGDGTSLAFNKDGILPEYVRLDNAHLGARKSPCDPRQVATWIGRSLVEILTHALDHGDLPEGRPWRATT